MSLIKMKSAFGRNQGFFLYYDQSVIGGEIKDYRFFAMTL
jgi:hypothetical protein